MVDDRPIIGRIPSAPRGAVWRDVRPGRCGGILTCPDCREAKRSAMARRAAAELAARAKGSEAATHRHRRRK